MRRACACGRGWWRLALGEAYAYVLAAVLGLGAGWLARLWAARLVGSEVRAARVLGPACGALAWALIVYARGPELESCFQCLVCIPLLACSLTDLAAYVIPNACVAGAASVRAAYLLAVGLCDSAQLPALLARSLVGAAGTLVPMLALTLVMDRVLGTDSMGGGDLKLLAVCGLWVGLRQMLFLLPVACVGGILSSVMLTRAQDGPSSGALSPFPFGPSIALALLVTFLVGPHVEAWLAAWVF